MSGSLPFDPYDGPRLAALKCINEILEKLKDHDDEVLAGYDDYALRELAGHLRQLNLGSTANRLMAYHLRHVKQVTDWFFSDYAVGLDGQAIKELISDCGEFPLPLTDPAEQSEVQETRRLIIIQNLRNLGDRLRSLRDELLGAGAQIMEADARGLLLPDAGHPNSVDLKELLRRVFKTKQRRDVSIVDRAFAIALREPEKVLSAAERKLLEDAVEGGINVSFTGSFSGTVRYTINDDRFKSLVTVRHLFLATAEIRDEELRRLRIHSGKMNAWEFAVDRLGAAVAQRKRSLNGYGDRHYDEQFIGEYCWRLVSNKPIQHDEFEEHVAALQKEGFTEELIRDLLTYCPVEADEMKLGSAGATRRNDLSEPPELSKKNRVMTDGQRRLWNALEARAFTGKELAATLDTTEDTIRQLIKELRDVGYNVENRRGRGYYRPDAPPN